MMVAGASILLEKLRRGDGMTAKSVFLTISAVLAMACAIGTADAAEQRFIAIGTGGVTGVYYPTGGAICRSVNKGRKTHGIRCSIESTGGSVDNINAVRNGELDMGIAQSDWEYHAFRGSSMFSSDGPFEDLRSLFSMHAEPFTVVARADAGISNFEDLKGKRVNIGNLGSGQRGTMEVLMTALGWDMSVFSSVSELKSAEQSAALCEDQIDAMVFTVGHPSGSIKEATTSCDSVLVNVAGPAVDRLIAENKYYRTTEISGDLYRGNESNIMTFGVGAVFVSSASLDADVVYQVVKSVFENFDDFKKLHPALQTLTKKEMANTGLCSPLHEGALRYYKEVGLI